MDRTVPDAHRTARRVMYAGMALTAALMLAPIVDAATVDSVAGHVRSAYPNWPDRLVAADRNAIVGWLGAVGLLGVAAWFWAILSARPGRRSARWVGTAMFTLGLVISLVDASVGGGPYHQIVPLTYGLLGLLPVAVGLVAVVLLWLPAPRGHQPTGHVRDRELSGSPGPVAR
jgi:MFS family permease